MVREMQSRARHGWQAVQGSFTTYSNKWQRVWTLRGPQDECGALSCDGAARRKTCLSQSARIRLFGRTCMLFYLRLGRIRAYSTPPDPWAPGASPGPVLRATYAALVAHEEAPARVCLKCPPARAPCQRVARYHGCTAHPWAPCEQDLKDNIFRKLDACVRRRRAICVLVARMRVRVACVVIGHRPFCMPDARRSDLHGHRSAACRRRRRGLFRRK